jgi:hypothetical protein
MTTGYTLYATATTRFGCGLVLLDSRGRRVPRDEAGR